MTQRKCQLQYKRQVPYKDMRQSSAVIQGRVINDGKANSSGWRIKYIFMLLIADNWKLKF